MDIYLEIFGYIGTILVILSMAMRSVKKLRIFNICGSFISMIYAAVCNTLPIAIMNGTLIIINFYHLMRSKHRSRCSECVEVSLADRATSYFLTFFEDGIKEMFPSYVYRSNVDAEAHIVYIEDKVAGILIGKPVGDTFAAEIYYVIKKFRYLSDKTVVATLSERGIKHISVPCENVDVQQYFEKMGYIAEDGLMIKEI